MLNHPITCYLMSQSNYRLSNVAGVVACRVASFHMLVKRLTFHTTQLTPIIVTKRTFHRLFLNPQPSHMLFYALAKCYLRFQPDIQMRNDPVKHKGSKKKPLVGVHLQNFGYLCRARLKEGAPHAHLCEALSLSDKAVKTPSFSRGVVCAADDSFSRTATLIALDLFPCHELSAKLVSAAECQVNLRAFVFGKAFSRDPRKALCHMRCPGFPQLAAKRRLRVRLRN